MCCRRIIKVPWHDLLFRQAVKKKSIDAHLLLRLICREITLDIDYEILLIKFFLFFD